jgi:hypothetical protein
MNYDDSIKKQLFQHSSSMCLFLVFYIYIIAVISSWTAGLNDRPVYARFVIDKVTLGQFSSKYPDIPL